MKSARQLTLFGGELAAPSPGRLAPPAAPILDEPVDEAVRRAARQLETDLVLRAGAGTGKTHTLVSVVAHLVAGVTRVGRRVPVSSILLLTFSEKAAAELRERVRRRLHELAGAPRSDPALEAAYLRSGATPLGSDGWRAAIRSLGAATVTTFHGFAAGLLRRHAQALGLDPDFGILDEDDAHALLDQTVRGVTLAALEGAPGVAALVRELDFARGAFGRGRALVEHVAELVGRLREEGRRAADLEGDDAGAARAGLAAHRQTYLDAVDDVVAALAGRAAAGIVARHRELVELRAAVADSVAGFDGSGPCLEVPVLAQVHELTRGSLGTDARREAAARLRAAEAALTGVHLAARAAPLHGALVELVGAATEAYAAEKRARSVLDFTDLLGGARDLLAGDEAVRTDEQARHAAVLVDEFQDTNGLQDDLLGLVRDPAAPLLVVGDPKQSIYEFRGADVAIFERAATRVEAAGGRARALVESRRGRRPLVAFVNRLFARALGGGEHPFELAWVDDRDALHAHRAGTGACVEIVDSPCETVLEEARAVARRVRDLVAGGASVVGDPAAPRPARWGDVAILLRRFTRLDVFLAELRRAQVPHYVVNGRGFYEAQEVRDLVHALTLLDDPGDALSLLGVLRSPLVGLSDASLLALSGRRARLELAPLLAPDFVPPGALDAGERERLDAFVTLYRRLHAHADRLGAAGTLRLLVDETDLRAVLATTFSGEQRIANLERLLAHAATFDEEGAGDRRAFVRRLRAMMARERSLTAPAQIVGEREDVVRVMTVHQAKGLEFPVVVIPECGAPERDVSAAVVYDREAGLGFRLRIGEGRLPTPRAVRAEDVRRRRSRAESLRLFYVAATRARDLLILSGEPGKGWRREVDDLLQAEPATRDLVRLTATVTATATATVTATATATAAPLTLPRLRPATPTARLIVAPVTELADFALCPRRYHLRHEVGLSEFPTFLERPVDGAAATEIRGDDDLVLDAPGLDAAERGTLAHRLLERVDLAAPHGAALRAIAAELGHDPDAPEVAWVCRQVAAFLAGPFGRSLAERPSGAVARELPFAFAIGQEGRARVLVKGQMDLVVRDGDELTVLDYKLVRGVPEGAYREQLLAYAAAARALWRPARLRVGLVLLAEAAPAPRLVDVGDAELDEAMARLAQGAGALARARLRRSFDGRPLATCRALGCGYRVRCHDDEP